MIFACIFHEYRMNWNCPFLLCYKLPNNLLRRLHTPSVMQMSEIWAFDIQISPCFSISVLVCRMLLNAFGLVFTTKGLPGRQNQLAMSKQLARGGASSRIQEE